MTWLPILKRVDVLAWVAPVLGPRVVDQCSPIVVLLFLCHGLHRDLNGSGFDVGRQLNVQLMLVVNMADYFDGAHDSWFLAACRAVTKRLRVSPETASPARRRSYPAPSCRWSSPLSHPS